MTWLRELIIPVLLFFAPAPSAHPAPPPVSEITCGGVARQGGLLICSGPAETDITIIAADGSPARIVRTDADGDVLIGLRQDEAAALVLAAEETGIPALNLDIAPRNDDFRTIKGLECDKVDARTEEQIEHAGQSWVKKQDAFGKFNEGPGAWDGFVLPADGPPSSPFGPTRKYIGTGADGQTCEKVSVHQGYDMAVATGTAITAPAGGTVILADPDLYYEGGTVFLDHGDGLVSVFMHMSAVDVEAGDVVEQGGRLGASGNTGRTTGPHLHWAVKWRNRASEDRDGDFYIDPALLLKLDTGAIAKQP